MLRKIFTAFLMVLIFCGVCFSASYNPYDLNYFEYSTDDEAEVYGRYGNTNYNFFYQLRDITGASNREKVGGSQWFATVYENLYYSRFQNLVTTDEYVGVYRRTMGGETPEITFNTVGDIIDGFNYIFAEEPQPYESMWRRYIGLGVFDVYPDPIESVCIVTTDGQAEFNLNFGNPYARHFPFWWSWNSTTSTVDESKWWQSRLNWRDMTYPTTEPIEYIYSSPYIYKRSSDFTEYNKIYEYASVVNDSGDITGYVINDTSGNLVYTISGDVDGEHEFYNTDNTLVYSVSDNQVYNSSGSLVYTIENDASNDDKYICDIRDVYESIAVTGFDDYNVTVTPSNENAISSSESLGAKIRFRGDSSNYGSTQGWLTFRQRASFATGYSNYREFSTIPIVVANVSSGNAESEPLIFDIIIRDPSDNTVMGRKKFTWDVQSNIQEDLGTFFVMEPYIEKTDTNTDSPVITYDLETRITNRTGTRYELYRYDGMRTRTGDVEYRDDYANIMPDHWKYDLTPDSYGTLPSYFLLDAHSQIAPGLVTVYKENIGDGYSTMSMGNVITDSFRLYEYSEPTPRNLSLKHRRIKGLIIPPDDGAPVVRNGSDGESESLQPFSIEFADDNIDDTTLGDLARLMYKIPGIIPADILTSMSTPRLSPRIPYTQTGSDTTNSFQIYKEVPDGFVNYEFVEIETESEDTEPEEDNPSETPVENPTETETTSALIAQTESFWSSDKAAIIPVKIRLTLPKNNTFINSHWEELMNASDSDEMFDIVSSLLSVWVKVPNTIAVDAKTDLFKALNTAENRGGISGARAKDFVTLTINDKDRTTDSDDELYIDFIVFLADAAAPDSRQGVNPNRPIVAPFVYTFEDDDVPYILIGDGKVDKIWDMTFFVASPDDSIASSSLSENEESQNLKDGSGGGTCNFGLFGIVSLIFTAAAVVIKH